MLVGISVIFIPMFTCNSEGEDKFYDMSCSIGKQKPSEVEKPVGSK